MPLAIEALLAQRPDEAAIAAFLAAHSFPLVEGAEVTFVYHGPASAVRLRHFIFGLPTAQPFTRVIGTQLWYHTIDLPPGSRVEYKLEIELGGKKTWIRDPRNPAIARDPFGANSVCQGAGYEPPEWTEPDSEARPGYLEDFTLEDTAFGEPRRVTVYVPARFRLRRRYHLLVCHDGGDYLRYAALKTVLDNLIHRLEVAPLIVALTHPGDRLVEYPDDPRHAQFIAEQLVPAMEERYPLLAKPASRGIMGASFGAV
ncbi:MAG: hypothetical protein KC636_08385, partial [Myxococcales bacterium]|nr:hypothetical protein [Myxococcales bacterium]